MTRLAGSVRFAAIATSFGLLIVLASVGAVATVAELRGDWSSYLVMEKAISLSTPVALGLAVAAVAAMFGLALVADR